MTRSQIFTAAHKSAKFAAAWMSYRKRFAIALKAEYKAAKAAQTFLSPEEVVERINKIDRAFNPRIEGGFIIGYYRGVRSNFYKFDIVNRVCPIDNAGFSSIINKVYTI